MRIKIENKEQEEKVLEFYRDFKWYHSGKYAIPGLPENLEFPYTLFAEESFKVLNVVDMRSSISFANWKETHIIGSGTLDCNTAWSMIVMDGDIIPQRILDIRDSGKIYYRDVLIETDKDLVHAFKEIVTGTMESKQRLKRIEDWCYEPRIYYKDEQKGYIKAIKDVLELLK